MRPSGSPLQSRSSEPDAFSWDNIAAQTLSEDDRRRLTDILAKTESNIVENVLPFWTRNFWDEEYGGFITHLDRKGNRTGVTDKFVLMQGRTIWALSAAHRFGLRDKRYLELAGKGVDFLLQNMWDSQYGGFYWCVKRNGEPKNTKKQTVGQAFAIVGLAEYATASGDKTAITWAEKTFELISRKAGDGELGFLENFKRDWTHETQRGWDRKNHGNQLSLMEALTCLALSLGNEEHMIGLRKLMELLVTKSIHKEYDCCSQLFTHDWRPLPTPGVAASLGRILLRLGFRTATKYVFATSYGHNVKFAWQLLDAVDTLGLSRELVRKPVLGLMSHALEFGFDSERGGVASYGPLTGKTLDAMHLSRKRLIKNWWEQAEMLIALIEVFRWTGDHRYLVAFEKQFSWIWRFQIDHEYGDWYAQTDWYTGRALIFDKGNAWKTLYHNSRTLNRVARSLRALLA